MTCEYERPDLYYMMKAKSTALSLQIQLLDRAEVMLRIRWSEQKLREKFLPSGSASVFI